MLAQEQSRTSEQVRQRAATLEQLRRQAEAGDARAQFRLGVIYEEGLGVPANGRVAERWYRRAAMQNDADAQLALAVVYAVGDGVDRDYGQSYVWFAQAAAQGHKDAGELRDLVAGELGKAAYEGAVEEARRIAAALRG